MLHSAGLATFFQCWIISSLKLIYMQEERQIFLAIYELRAFLKC